MGYTSGTTCAAEFYLGKTDSDGKPLFLADFKESCVSSGFVYGSYANHLRIGGTGHRQALTGQITVQGAAQGEMNVGLCGFGFLSSGSGDIFGINAYAQALPAASSDAEIIGIEINTDVQRAVTRKVGAQIIDVSSSVAQGTVIDSGMLIGKQPGGGGFTSGIQFGISAKSDFGIRPGGTLIYSASDAPSQLRVGIDFRKLSSGFSVAAIVLPPVGGVGLSWGDSGEGGKLTSNAMASGMNLIFADGFTVFRNRAGTSDCVRFDDNQSADKVFIYVGGSLKQVTCGPADSGGAGYRNLRVSN